MHRTKVIAALRLTFGLLLAAILIAALMPAADAPSVFVSDKLNHMFAFFVLAFAAKCLWPRASILMPFVLLAAYGALIEILQLVLGYGRSADWLDFAADVLAICIGLAAAGAVNALRKRAVQAI